MEGAATEERRDGGADRNEDQTFHSQLARCHVVTILPDEPQVFRLNTQIVIAKQIDETERLKEV